VARTEQDLSSLAQAAQVEYFAGDLGTAEGCARIAEEARRRLGQVDILVNNAGVDMRECPIWDQATAIWRRAMAVSLDAPFELTRLLTGGMTRRRRGPDRDGELDRGHHGRAVCGRLLRLQARDSRPHAVGGLRRRAVRECHVQCRDTRMGADPDVGSNGG
jgi:NAD(P)-dependent dehydrogenase (short-subunit alcohol dehydrogenase family)